MLFNHFEFIRNQAGIAGNSIVSRGRHLGFSVFNFWNTICTRQGKIDCVIASFSPMIGWKAPISLYSVLSYVPGEEHLVPLQSADLRYVWLAASSKWTCTIAGQHIDKAVRLFSFFCISEIFML